MVIRGFVRAVFHARGSVLVFRRGHSALALSLFDFFSRMEELRNFAVNFISQRRDDFACLELARSSPQALFWRLPSSLKSSLGLGRVNIIKESYDTNQIFLESARLIEILAHDPHTELSDILVYDEKFKSYYSISKCYVFSTNPSFHYTIAVSMLLGGSETTASIPVYTESEARAAVAAGRTNCRAHALYLLPSSLPKLPLSLDTIEYLLRASGRYHDSPEPETINELGSDGVIITRALRCRPPLNMASEQSIIDFANSAFAHCTRLRDLLVSVVRDVFIDNSAFFFSRYWKPTIVRATPIERLQSQLNRIIERPFDMLFTQTPIAVKSMLQLLADQSYALFQAQRSELPVPPISPRRRVDQHYASLANSYQGTQGVLQKILQYGNAIGEEFVQSVRYWKLAWERTLATTQTDGEWPFCASDILTTQWTLFYTIPKLKKRSRKNAGVINTNNVKKTGRGMPQILKSHINILSLACDAVPPPLLEDTVRMFECFTSYTTEQLENAVKYYSFLTAANEKIGVTEMRVVRHPALHILDRLNLITWVGANQPVQFVEDHEYGVDPRILIRLTCLETQTDRGILKLLLYASSKFTSDAAATTAPMVSREFKDRLHGMLNTREAQYFQQNLCEHPIIVLDHPTINRTGAYNLVVAMHHAFDYVVYPGQSITSAATSRNRHSSALWACFVGVERWTPRELFKALYELVMGQGAARAGPFRLLILADLKTVDITGTLKYLKDGFQFAGMRTVVGVDPIALLGGRTEIQQQQDEGDAMSFVPLKIDTTYREQFLLAVEQQQYSEWCAKPKSRKKLRLGDDEVFDGATIERNLIKYRLCNVNYADIRGVDAPQKLYTLYSYSKCGFCM